jgi:hypothetical protein
VPAWRKDRAMDNWPRQLGTERLGTSIIEYKDRPVWILGTCSDGSNATELLRIFGSDASTQSSATLQAVYAGYTCDNLTAGSQSDVWDSASNTTGGRSISRFLGKGTNADIKEDWNAKLICNSIPSDYVAIGYEHVAGPSIDAVRFVMASGEQPSLLLLLPHVQTHMLLHAASCKSPFFLTGKCYSIRETCDLNCISKGIYVFDKNNCALYTGPRA